MEQITESLTHIVTEVYALLWRVGLLEVRRREDK